MKYSKIVATGMLQGLLTLTGFAQSPVFDSGTTVLFQGDSITDGGRGRTEDPNHVFGQDYAYLITARMGVAFPERHINFINRGISGNTVNDLLARWQTDTLDLKPDVLSILIGVNDVLHKVRAGEPFSVDEYEKSYDQLLGKTVAALPHVKLILGQPFFAPGKITDAHPDEWKRIMPQVDAVVERLAKKYHAPVVPYQEMFNRAAQRAPFSFWIWDGVHPTAAGHGLMADEWLRTFTASYPSQTDTKSN